jgi:hypothetical protein
MRFGYGRGYYGSGQLVQPPARRRGSGWVKLALVVGAGAVIWLMWPRTPKLEHESDPGGDEPKAPAPLPTSPDAAVQTSSAQSSQLSQVAEARGYPSRQAHEGAAVASARQLQDTGARGYLPQQAYEGAAVASARQLQDTGARGYLSQQAYEDAVVASARQLQATGAKVVLAPHLAHLASRLGP